MDAEKQNSRTVTEAQVFSRQWTPPTGVLGRIMVESANRVAAMSGAARRDVELAAASAPARPSLLDALTRETVQVIAEIKRYDRVWFATGSEIIDAYQQVA